MIAMLLGALVILVSLGVVVASFVARPSMTVAVGVVLVLLGFCGCGTYAVVYSARLDSRPEYYSLETRPAGKHRLTIRPIKGAGLEVQPVRKGVRGDPLGGSREESPVDFKLLEACRWRVSLGGGAIHTHDAACPCNPKHGLFESNRSMTSATGEAVPFEVEYEVNETSRSLLEGIELRASCPGWYSGELSVQRVICRMVAGVSFVMAGLAALGLVVMAWRARAPAPSTSGPPAP